METDNKPTSVLQLARIKVGLRQKDVAHEIGRSTQFISRVENGGSATLTPELAERIGAVVAVSPGELFGDAFRPGGSR
jgi:transcriptional regulator with XRE-family HTH domain